MFEEEQNYMLPDDELDENQLWENIKIHEVKHKTKLNDPENILTELQHIHKPISGLNTCSEGRFRDNAKIKLKQNSEIALTNMRAKVQGIPFAEKELASDYRYQLYLQIVTRIEISNKRFLHETIIQIQEPLHSTKSCFQHSSSKSSSEPCIVVTSSLLRTELPNSPEWDLGLENIYQLEDFS